VIAGRSNSKKLIHVLGGGLWQVPTIRLAKELGYSVLVSDMYEERPGYEYADAHEIADIRDLAKTLEIAKRHRIDGIICDTTDVGVPTAAYVAEQLGLPGIGSEIAMRFTDKSLMRDITSRAGVDNPRYALLSSPSELGPASHVGFPTAVKPVDNQSSRGVSRVTDPSELEAAVRDAFANSAKKTVLLEEWIEGTEVTAEAMCQDGAVFTLAISDKVRYADVPQVASRLTYPAAMDDVILQRIADTNAAVISALGLRTGVTHAEYIVTNEGRVCLVEIAARGAGSRIHSHIVPFLSGVPLPRLYLEYCLGDRSRWPKPDGVARAAILDFFSFPRGIVRSIRGVDEAASLPGVVDLALEIEVGRRFEGVDNDRSRPGYVVALGTTRAEVIEIAETAKRIIQVDIEPTGR
jgi:carbamoyl-phosphate synthase large subunit